MKGFVENKRTVFLIIAMWMGIAVGIQSLLPPLPVEAIPIIDIENWVLLVVGSISAGLYWVGVGISKIKFKVLKGSMGILG